MAFFLCGCRIRKFADAETSGFAENAITVAKCDSVVCRNFHIFPDENSPPYQSPYFPSDGLIKTKFARSLISRWMDKISRVVFYFVATKRGLSLRNYLMRMNFSFINFKSILKILIWNESNVNFHNYFWTIVEIIWLCLKYTYERAYDLLVSTLFRVKF